MPKEEISTRKLNDDILTQIVLASPSPISLHLTFKSKNNRKDSGYILISDNLTEQIRVSLIQTPDSWMYQTPPSEVFLNITNQKNATYRHQYIKGVVKRGYSLSEGRVLFSYGGKTSNPDKLNWEDSFAEISKNRINLTLGESTPDKTISELKRWLKDFI